MNLKNISVFLCEIILKVIARGQPVRIGIMSAKGRISQMITYLEPYLRQLRKEGKANTLLIVVNPGKCPNEQLSLMYGRLSWLFDDRTPLRRWLFLKVYGLLQRGRSPMAADLYSRIGHNGPINENFTPIWNEEPPVLEFSEDERRKGKKLLSTMGVGENAHHICFGLRDRAYYAQFLTEEAQKRHQNREAGDDYSPRNPPLSNYLPMAEQCAQQGYFVIRMGQMVGEPIPDGLDSRIIDYATHHRSPFGDVFLPAHCRFLVTGGAAVCFFACMFNRPVIVSDSYNICFRPIGKHDLFIPKKYWLKSEERFLTFREMLEHGNDISNAKTLEHLGVDIVHNSADEIQQVVHEMIQRLDGAWQSSEDDEDLQHRFDSLYTPEHLGYKMPSRMGAVFLRQHAHLL